MNAHREEPAGRETLADALLAIDGGMPTSSAEGRKVAQEALRRDRRRVRIVTGMTIGLFVFAVVAVCLPISFCYMKILPAANKCQQDLDVLGQQLDKQQPQLDKPDLLGMTARITAGLGGVIFPMEVINLWGISALLAIILAAAFCTVVLVMATRRATLRQIQVSLLVLSEQLDRLQRPLQGGGQTPQEPGVVRQNCETP